MSEETVRRRLLWVSKSPGKVVARYADGKVLKGYAYDFAPERPRFCLVPVEGPGGEGTEVEVKNLKAVFFVRSFAGNRGYHECKDLDQPRPPATRKVVVEFEDGEILVGYTREFDPRRPGFLFTPLDPQSNNLRVFAVFAATSSVSRLL